MRLSSRTVTLLATLLIALPASAKVVTGDQAPPITLEAVTNAPDSAPTHDALSWNDFDGKTVVLEFWGTWCGPCVSAIPHLNKLADALPAEDFAFLAVTYEDVPTIEDFLDRLEMKSWIGHDTDRSMVDAYGVRGWPTTFIIRDGVVLERTHPTALSEESLLAFSRAEVDDLVAKAEAERVAAAEKEAARPTSESLLEIRIAPSAVIDESGGWGSSGPRRISGNSIKKRELARVLWNTHAYQDIEIDEPEARYDVAIDAFAAPEEVVREVAASALALEMTVETREMDGYIATVGEGGLRLESGLMDGPMGFSMRGSGESYSLASSSMTLASLLEAIERHSRLPIRNDTGVSDDRYFFVELTLPRDESELRSAIEDQIGLMLIPARLEREVAVIRSRSAD